MCEVFHNDWKESNLEYLRTFAKTSSIESTIQESSTDSDEIIKEVKTFLSDTSWKPSTRNAVLVR